MLAYKKENQRMAWFELLSLALPYLGLQWELNFFLQNCLLHLREMHNALQLHVLFFSVFLPALSRNIEATCIRDFGPCHNVKSHICCYITSFSHQNSAILKNNSKVRPELSLEKNCFWYCVAQCKKYGNFELYCS